MTIGDGRDELLEYFNIFRMEKNSSNIYTGGIQQKLSVTASGQQFDVKDFSGKELQSKIVNSPHSIDVRRAGI